jgi:uncharacterized protein YecE (DUF72 family)
MVGEPVAGGRPPPDAVSQLPLFDVGDAIEPIVTDEDRALAERLPSFVHFGTSSWSFPGWAGLVWRGTPTESALARSGLSAYAKHPLFRAVSLDRSYYAPLRKEEVDAYATQLARAPHFRMVPKVWDEITTAVFPSHPRYGARAGQRNPHFLDANVFRSEVLPAYGSAPFIGPLVFELTPMPAGTFDERTLVARVDDFIARLPAGRWAFELRNADMFGRRWLDMLRANGVAHALTYWTAMPPLRDQLRLGALVAPFTVVRLMLPPFTRYAARKVDFEPFDKIVEPAPDMREDVITILRAMADRGGGDTFVFANNKAEGSAPLTIRALAARAAHALGT